MTTKEITEDRDKAADTDSIDIDLMGESLPQEEKEYRILKVLAARGCMTPTEIIVETLFLIVETHKCLRDLVNKDLIQMRKDSESIDGELVAITYEGLCYYRKFKKLKQERLLAALDAL